MLLDSIENTGFLFDRWCEGRDITFDTYPPPTPPACLIPVHYISVTIALILQRFNKIDMNINIIEYKGIIWEHCLLVYLTSLCNIYKVNLHIISIYVS